MRQWENHPLFSALGDRCIGYPQREGTGRRKYLLASLVPPIFFLRVCQKEQTYTKLLSAIYTFRSTRNGCPFQTTVVRGQSQRVSAIHVRGKGNPERFL